MFKIMKIEAFAKEICTPSSTIRTWKRRGNIPSSCFKSIGGTIFVKVDEFKNFLEQN